MDYTGKVFTLTESQLGTFTALVEGAYLIVRVSVGGNEVIHFPLASDTTSEQLQSRLGNICHQTGLIPYRARVEVDPGP